MTAPTLRATAALLAVLAGTLGAPAVRAQTTTPNDTPREKLAQTTMKFLAVSLDPRAAALGDAVTAVEGMPTAMFYNPASMARQQNMTSVNVAQTQWVFNFTHNAAAVSFAPKTGRYGVVGLSLQHVDYGDDFVETIRSNNAQGYDELGTYHPTAFAVGAGYAKALTDRFSVGAHVKYASVDLGNPVESRSNDGSLTRVEAKEGTFAYDFGMLYRTGYKSLNFAVSARNFSPEITYVRESAQLPLALRIGVSMNLADLTRLDATTHQLNATVDALNSRDYPEQIKAGLEYGFMNTFFLRGGAVTRGGEQSLSAGFGVQRQVRGVGFGADYAYTDMGLLNNFGRVHRLGLRFSF